MTEDQSVSFPVEGAALPVFRQALCPILNDGFSHPNVLFIHKLGNINTIIKFEIWCWKLKTARSPTKQIWLSRRAIRIVIYLMEFDMDSKKEGSRLFEKPWLAMLAVMGASIFSIALTGSLLYGVLGYPDDLPWVGFIQAISFQLLTGFIIAPFILRLPKGKTSFRKYLDDIGLTRLKPFLRLVLLGLSCALILALSQAAASLVFRLFEGNPVNGRFLKQVFDFSSLDPSQSGDLLRSLPSIFEEVAFRGIALTVFLGRYSVRKSIIFSSIGFSLMHLMNLTNGRELEWVLGQLVWSFLIGLFYGYVFVRSKSLWPAMIVHYLGNVTIGILSGYMINRAAVPGEVLYQIIFSFGIVPTTLMILWTRFFTEKWLPQSGFEKNLVE